MVNYPQYYQPQQIPQQFNDDDRIIWIQGGVNTALAYMLAPSQRCVYMMDENEDPPCLYYKTRVDGKPYLEIYDLVKRSTKENTETTEEKTKYLTSEDLTDFVTKKDMSDILKEIQNLRDDILDIQTTPGDGESAAKTKGRK